MSRTGTIALTALAPLAWGSTYAVTTQWLPADRPLFAGLTRALPAGLLLMAGTRARPRGAWWGKAAVLGALNIGAFFPLLFLAAYRLPGGVAAVCGAVGPLFTVALSAGLLRERPTRRSVGAALAGALGVAMVVLRPGAGADAAGLLAGLGGAASMAAGTVLTKRWGRPEGVGPLAFTGWQLTAGGLLIAPVALLAEGVPPAVDGRNVLGYAYLALANTAAAYALWFRGIGRLPAASVSLLALLSTISAAAVGWLALGQSLDPLQLAGVAVALGGTLLGQRTGSRRPAPPAAGRPGRPVRPAVPSSPTRH
jgi:probable blue pigment (indigoidine) exporter